MMFLLAGSSGSAFPCHQPVLDTPKLKADYSSYMTSSREYGSNLPSLKPGASSTEHGDDATKSNTRAETGKPTSSPTPAEPLGYVGFPFLDDYN